jgi:hypothetical protein
VSTVVDPDTGEQPIAADTEQAPDAAVEPLTCPNCSAPADPGQLMCLECGSRLALDYRRAPSWRLPAAIIGVVVLLAGIGIAIALLAATHDNKSATAAAPPATTPTPQTAPADSAPTTSTATPSPTASTPTPAPTITGSTGTPAAPPATPGAPAPPPPTPTSSGWPPGKSAFTVILASMPSKSDADAKLKAAQAAGITTAAILHSDDFPTLNPGYWVVFDGQYDSNDQAQAQATADHAKGDFKDAYARFVSKDPNAKP